MSEETPSFGTIETHPLQRREPLTERGLELRLARILRERAYWIPEWKRWIYFSDREDRWVRDDPLWIEREGPARLQADLYEEMSDGGSSKRLRRSSRTSNGQRCGRRCSREPVPTALAARISSIPIRGSWVFPPDASGACGRESADSPTGSTTYRSGPRLSRATKSAPSGATSLPA